MPTTYSVNRTLGSGVGTIVIVSFLSAAALFATSKQLHHAIEMRERSEAIIRSLDAFRAAMLNQETGIRGYLLTGAVTSLEPYRAARPALDDAIARLRRSIGENSPEAEKLRAAEGSARMWQANVGEIIIRDMVDPDMRSEAGRVESSGEGKRLFDEFREKLGAIQDEEERTLAAQQDVLARAERHARLAVWGGAAAVLLICAAVGLAINRIVARPLMRLADAMRRLAQRDLTVEVPGTRTRNEVGEMARAVQVFKTGLIELDRSSLLRTTADTLPAMVGYVDSARRIGFLNAEFERCFDLKAGDVSDVNGRPLAQVFATDPFPGADRELEAAFGGAETRSEHQLALRGSGRRDVEAFYRPHRAPDGRVLGVVTLLTDITERKAMERRLAQQASDLLRSNEELEQFAYVASHDLKAPLRGIENLVGWIEEDVEGALTDDARTNMGLLKSRVRRLESLLDDLLAYSRAGRGGVASEVVDTRKLVEDLVVLVSPPEGFRVVVSPSLPTLSATRAPLTQVLQNLIGNAIKHHDHPADGHIWVDAQKRANEVEFTLTDDGPGIPARFHDRVFDMFQTLKPRDEVEGSGMGLAIVKKLVERQGGRVWLGERRDGRGLSVHLVWPIIKTENADAAERQLASG